MKLLWIDLNSSYAHASLALPALHAQVMRHADIEWDVVSATANEPLGPVVEDIVRRRPDVLAATAWLFTHEALLHLLARVRALLPECVVILGGPEFLDDNEDYLRRIPWVDAVFRGEGEEMFPQWLPVWAQREQWREIPGLCYIDPLSHTYQDNDTARVTHFDRLVPPEESPFFRWDKPFVQLETTRGCFNTCAFCVSGGEKPVRSLPIEAIARRLENIRAHGIHDVRILDRTFNYNTRRACNLLRLFRTYHPHLHFHLEIHPALLDDELKSLLSDMPPGLLHLEAGIQSLHEDVLRACGRRGGLEASLDGLRYLCSLANMETHADLIAGLPLYQLEEIFEDARTLAGYGAGEIQLESLKLLPGTEMRRRAAELGIRFSPLPPYEVLQTREISPDELQTARLLSRLLDGFYNAKAWQGITRRLMIRYADFLHRFLDYLTEQRVADQPLSLERRGILLYDFCKMYYPDHLTAVSLAWIEAGMSLKKQPAERVRTKHVVPPARWDILYGTYHEQLRLCKLTDERDNLCYWYGFETESQSSRPVFKAQSASEQSEV